MLVFNFLCSNLERNQNRKACCLGWIVSTQFDDFTSENLLCQLVIAVFTGEAWGYLGSRRFLNELANGGSSVLGLNRSLVHQVR